MKMNQKSMTHQCTAIKAKGHTMKEQLEINETKWKINEHQLENQSKPMGQASEAAGM